MLNAKDEKKLVRLKKHIARVKKIRRCKIINDTQSEG